MWPLMLLAARRTYAAASAPVAALFVDHDQGRRLRRSAAVAAAVQRRGRRIGVLRPRMAACWGHRYPRVRLRWALGIAGFPRLASFNVIVSSGTLLAVIAVGNAAVTGGALLYLASSTLALSAFFLLIELVERGRIAGADVLAVTADAFGDDGEELEPVGVAIPTTMAILGIGFAACALLLAGLPPLSGFIAKFLILTAMFRAPPIPMLPPGPCWPCL